MKTLSPALQSHLDGELTTLATLIKITRTDGAVKAMTDCDHDLTVGGVSYLADASFSLDRLDNAAALKANHAPIEGVLDSAQIGTADLKNGLYDNARVDIYVCNWANLSQGVVQLRRGWLGAVTLSGGAFHAELHGLHDLLQRRVGDSYTPECRYDLGDSKCTINLTARTVSGTVTALIDTANFADSARSEASGLFDYGKLIWISGANQGFSVEVKSWNLPVAQFTLWLPAPHAIAIGDAYSVTQGCDKRFTSCINKFSNAVNFGGFPHLPGLNKILAYPDSH